VTAGRRHRRQELDDPRLRPDGFTILPGLAERGDLFRDVLDHPQQLPPPT
jgi:bifunctional non-homologous end joining protein LigD